MVRRRPAGLQGSAGSAACRGITCPRRALGDAGACCKCMFMHAGGAVKDRLWHVQWCMQGGGIRCEGLFRYEGERQRRRRLVLMCPPLSECWHGTTASLTNVVTLPTSNLPSGASHETGGPSAQGAAVPPPPRCGVLAMAPPPRLLCSRCPTTRNCANRAAGGRSAVPPRWQAPTCGPRHASPGLKLHAEAANR